MEMHLRNAHQVDLSRLHPGVPPTGIAAEIKVSVIPSSGAVLIYTAASDQPVMFSGPTTTKEISLSGTIIHAQLVSGAQSFRIDVLGYTDDI